MAPDEWPHRDGYEDNCGIMLALDAADRGEAVDFLSEDFCLHGGHFLIRCVLLLPIAGLALPFGFGCWATLSETNFRRYVDGFDSGQRDASATWTGWLGNAIQDLTSQNPIAVIVNPRPGRQRPVLEVIAGEEPLALAQRGGLPIERFVHLLDHYGHA